MSLPSGVVARAFFQSGQRPSTESVPRSAKKSEDAMSSGIQSTSAATMSSVTVSVAIDVWTAARALSDVSALLWTIVTFGCSFMYSSNRSA